MRKINEYIGIKEASGLLGVTKNTLRNWEKDNKLKVFRNPKNNYRLYIREELEQILLDINPGSYIYR